MRFCISRHMKNHFNFELKIELFISIIFPLGLPLALLPNFMKSCFEITMAGEVHVFVQSRKSILIQKLLCASSFVHIRYWLGFLVNNYGERIPCKHSKELFEGF